MWIDGLKAHICIPIPYASRNSDLPPNGVKMTVADIGEFEWFFLASLKDNFGHKSRECS